MIEIAIRQCRSSGIDCKIHGLAVRGRLKSDEDDNDDDGLPVNSSSYLASDGEDDSVTVVDDQLAKNDDVRQRLSTGARGPRDILTNVFVWGLNDKDQLGGPKGSKVCADLTFAKVEGYCCTTGRNVRLSLVQIASRGIR